MNGVVFAQVAVAILTVIFGASLIWGVHQITRPFPKEEKKECKNLN